MTDGMARFTGVFLKPVSPALQAFKKPAARRPFPEPIPATMWRLFKEFLVFLRQEKKWWLIPLVLILLLLAAVIVFTGGSVLAPLMYPFL
jgi:hypothetical protein